MDTAYSSVSLKIYSLPHKTNKEISPKDMSLVPLPFEPQTLWAGKRS